MKPVAFGYARPHSIDDALALLRRHGPDARVLAGGQSLVPELNRRRVRPSVLVDVTGLPGLRYLRVDGAGLRIGALTTHDDIARTADPAVLAGYKVLPRTAPLVAHHPIRTRGTFGGSIAHAHPGAEWCLLAVVLEARIAVAGPGGGREVPAGEFFRGAHRTALAPGDLVVEVRFPRPWPHAALVEHSVRAGDHAVALGAVALEVGDGRLTRLRVGAGGVLDRPIRLPGVERELTGAPVDDDLPGRVRALATAELAGALTDSAAPEAASGTNGRVGPGADDGGADSGDRAAVAAALVARALTAALPPGPAAAGRPMPPDSSPER